MALRGVKPTTVPKRMKALFFGAAGVGKTTAAIQFPKPYLIDTERGSTNDEYVEMLNRSGGSYFFSADFDEVLTEISSLLTEEHEYKTVIIDPLTIIYNDLCDKSAKALASAEDPTGTAFSRHKGPADRKLKHLLNLLLRLDMNVIITSHAKNEWANGKPTGTDTFDCYAKLDYLFDLVFNIQKRGKERFGIVRKTRVAGFPDGETFPFTYDEIADRYGREILERKAVAEVLASPEQVGELTRLIELLKVPETTVDKWLDKANAEAIKELPQSVAQKCIDHLNQQVRGESAAA